MKFSILIALFVILCLALPTSSQLWIYEYQNTWNQDWPACGGSTQSPINITTESAIQNLSLQINFHDYNFVSPDFRVNNTGHTIQFTYIGTDPQTAPSITGLALNGYRYVLAQIHFHWSQVDGIGSEHSFDGKKYEFEIHLVHFNIDKYPNYDAAFHSPEGVTVLGLFYMIHDENQREFESIVEMVNLVANKSESETIHVQHPLDLLDLLPHLTDDIQVFRYTGSLTTPPCTEGVNWLVMNANGFIGKDQIAAFRAVKHYQTNTLEGNNYRASQPLNGRIVEQFHLCWSTGVNNSLNQAMNSTYCNPKSSAQIVISFSFKVLSFLLFLTYFSLS